jgi:hypothetical protein
VCTNRGDALLHVISVYLPDSAVFFVQETSLSAAKTGFTLLPGEEIIIPIIFQPNGEDVFFSQLFFETSSHRLHLDLLGTGRQAQLLFDRTKVQLE